MKKLTPGKTAVIDPNDPSITPAATASMSDEQKRLRMLIARRHPEYADHLAHWGFLAATYNGGREWFNNVRILIINLAYEVVDLTIELGTTNTTVPVFQRIDRNYRNPA
ncbi:MAG: hypothetical protein WKG03_06980 [Telluria sp.]